MDQLDYGAKFYQLFYSCIFQENTCFKYLFSHLCKYPPVNTSTTCPLYCNPHCCVLNMKSTALAREVSFPMRSPAEAATQTLTAVILFLKSRSSVSFFSLSLFVIASFFIFSLTLFVIGAPSSLHFPPTAMETPHGNLILSFFLKVETVRLDVPG